MSDMLVKLYDLAESRLLLSQTIPSDVTIRKPLGLERSLIVQWARELVGFACYDAAALGYFGPIGVLEALRGKGVGKALMFACLLEMKLKGYGCAIIGWVGPQEFYEKTVGAITIPDSTPGIWEHWLGGAE